MDSNNTDTTSGAGASQNAVDLFSVFPAKLFHDLWRASEQPERSPQGHAYAYEVIKRTRIYDKEGAALWIDFARTVPEELEQWGTESISENYNLHQSNEDALRLTHDLIMELRNLSIRLVVKHEVQDNGCIHLRVNFGEKSYFTVRVHQR
ncbi:hypothetical protein F5B21DRAFT_309156 [Xylaria acuta]|nr:hypothetical protein F5B21DRAFT_309156 [Xylaria acuta]